MNLDSNPPTVKKRNWEKSKHGLDIRYLGIGAKTVTWDQWYGD